MNKFYRKEGQNMKKRSSIALLTALLAIVFAAGIGVYSNYIGMQIYEESSNHLLESYAQISKTFTLFVQRNWVVLSQWDSLMKNAQEDADIDSIWPDAQNNKLLWHYSDFYLFNEHAVSNGRWAKGQRRQHRRRFSGDVQQRASQSSPPIRQPTVCRRSRLRCR